MLEWKDVAPLLTIFVGTVGAIFGYGIQERRRAKAEQQAASPPAVLTAVSTGLEEKAKLDLIETHLVTHGLMLTKLVAHAEKDERHREQEELVQEVINRLQAAGVTLTPKPKGRGA